MAMLKIHCKASDAPAIEAVLGTQGRVVETYDSFVLADADAAGARALARRFPVENVDAQYRLPLHGALLDPLAPLPRTRGVATRAAAAPDALAPGPHHYLVQFIGPVKAAWVRALTKAGATLRHPTGGFAYVVLADDAALARLRALKAVRWVGHLPPADRIAPGLAGASAAPRTRSAGAAPSAPAQATRRRTVPGALVVEVFASRDLARVAAAARTLGFTVKSQDRQALQLLIAADGSAAGPDKIQSLAAVHGVRYIRERVLPRVSNDVATALMGNAYSALKSSGLRLSGQGEIVAVCDTGLDSGDAADIHPDFAGRVVAIKSYPITRDWADYVNNPGANDGAADVDSGHGTHVSGSVLGNGSASSAGAAPIRGHAYEARLVFQAVEQEMKWKGSAPSELRDERYVLAGLPNALTSFFQYAYGLGARIHSNSWGGGDPGAYDSQCRQFDDFVWKHKDMCFVIAAGNDGTDHEGDGKVNLGSVASPGTAKNCITVGACESRRTQFNSDTYGSWWPDDYPAAPLKNDPMANDPKQMVGFSSRGPTLDGRVKPDVVAPGTFILSTRSRRIAANNFGWAAYPGNKLYFYMGGTSMATPLVAGAVALLREYLRTKRHMAHPSAALVKAVMIAGAERLPKTAPARTLFDPHQGYGRVDLDRALKKLLLAHEGQALATGASARMPLKLTTAGKTLRIVLAYSDYPGDTLINNLNLVVTDPAGTRHLGNQPAGKAAAGFTMDSANNVELVQVGSAKKGTWTIDVIASNVTTAAPQDFALSAVLV